MARLPDALEADVDGNDKFIVDDQGVLKDLTVGRLANRLINSNQFSANDGEISLSNPFHGVTGGVPVAADLVLFRDLDGAATRTTTIGAIAAMGTGMGGAPPFHLHNDVTGNARVLDDDRMLFSDESLPGGPNNYRTVSQFIGDRIRPFSSPANHVTGTC